MRLNRRGHAASRLAAATETFPVRVRFDEPRRLATLIRDAVAAHGSAYRREPLICAAERQFPLERRGCVDIRLLPVDVPIAEFGKRNALAGDRAGHVGARHDHLEIAVEISEPRLAVAADEFVLCSSSLHNQPHAGRPRATTKFIRRRSVPARERWLRRGEILAPRRRGERLRRHVLRLDGSDAGRLVAAQLDSEPVGVATPNLGNDLVRLVRSKADAAQRLGAEGERRFKGLAQLVVDALGKKLQRVAAVPRRARRPWPQGTRA